MKPELQELQRQVAATVESFSDVVDDEGLKQVRVFVKVGEWKLALEFLCDVLSEDQVVVAEEKFAKLVATAKLLNVDSSYWCELERE